MKTNSLKVGAVALSLTVSVAVLPAVAATGNGGNGTNPPANGNGIGNLYKSFESTLSSKISGVLNTVTGVLNQAGFGNIISDLGLDKIMSQLPDLKEIEKEILEAFKDSGDTTGAREATNEAVRAVTVSVGESTLSEEGQQKTAEDIERDNTAATEMDTAGEEAQSETVTQNVLKKMAIQNQKAAVLLNSASASLKGLNVKTDLANRNLTNISEGIDRQNLARETDADAAALSSLRTAAMGGLF
jgi:hypothetical protein